MMVIIAGDSWGVSEYKKNGDLYGPGIAQWLQLCVDVVNLSRGGGSNTRALYKLDQFLKRYTPTPQDRFVWIVTSPERCANNSIEQFIDKNDSMYNILLGTLSNSLDSANDIAKQHNVIIEVVGGVCDLTHVNKEYSNLDIKVKSWGMLLSNNYSPNIIDPDFVKHIGPIVKEKFPDKLTDWLDLAELAQQKILSWESMRKTYFKTDNSHPDRDGHYALLCKLFPTLVKYYG